MAPSLNGSNNRGNGGKFVPGNKEGRGNPMAKYVNRLRVALLRAVTPNDMKKIISKLIKNAKAGNVMAAKEVLDRTLGRSMQPMEHSGPDGGPIETAGDIDLSKLSFEELEYMQTLRTEVLKRGSGDKEKEQTNEQEQQKETQ